MDHVMTGHVPLRLQGGGQHGGGDHCAGLHGAAEQLAAQQPWQSAAVQVPSALVHV